MRHALGFASRVRVRMREDSQEPDEHQRADEGDDDAPQKAIRTQTQQPEQKATDDSDDARFLYAQWTHPHSACSLASDRALPR